MRRNIKIRSITPLFLIGFMVIAFLAAAVARAQYQLFRVKAQNSDLEKKIVALEKENANIGELLNALDDPSKIEREARARLNLKKPDEEAVILIPQGNVTQETKELPAQNSVEEESFFKKWLRRLFGD